MNENSHDEVMRRLIAMGVVVPVGAAMSMYVTDYYPPDDGHKRPGHEHVEQQHTSTSQVTGTPVVVALTGVQALGQVGNLGTSTSPREGR